MIGINELLSAEIFLTDPHGEGGLAAFSGQAALLAGGLQHPGYAFLHYFSYVA